MNQELKYFEFNLKTKTRFGEGISKNLGQYLKEFSFERIGIIVDPAILKLPIMKEILKVLEKESLKTKIWEYNLNFEPTYEALDETRKKFVDGKKEPLIDCFVGIGGGSVIDFSKGLATLATNHKPAINYKGFPTDLNPPLPVIAIPTTAGTASEVTYNAVFINDKDKKKLGINTMYNFPFLAILDPTLTVSCPRSVTLSSGADALVHTLESYGAVQSNIVTRIFAKKAFELIFNNLDKVVNNPEDIEIRANLLLGSYLAGISLMNSGSGPTGALSYILGTHFDVPHGFAGAIFLPHVIEHNVNNGSDYSELFDLIDDVDKSIDRKMKNILFSKKLSDLWKNLKMPSNLKEFGVDEGNIEILLNETENLDKAFAQNPVVFSVEDGKKLLLKMLK